MCSEVTIYILDQGCYADLAVTCNFEGDRNVHYIDCEDTYIDGWISIYSWRFAYVKIDPIVHFKHVKFMVHQFSFNKVV